MRDIISFLRFTVFPYIKVRSRFWWWVIKYRGKKNIPKEVVFGALIETAGRLSNDFEMARRTIPDAMPEQERQQLYSIIEKIEEFERMIHRMKWESDDSGKNSKNKKV